MKALTRTDVAPSQAALRKYLVRAIRAALPVTRDLEKASQSADRAYRAVAVFLVELRHQFRASDGVKPDLNGRSHGYRRLVRSAYQQAGAAGDGPIEKRLTVGVSYWVRKVLIEQYGEDSLREMGVLPDSVDSTFHRLVLMGGRVKERDECLAKLVEVLNLLASDPSFIPHEELVRSATRAILLLEMKIRRRIEVA